MMRNIMIQPFPLDCNSDYRLGSSRKSSRKRSRSPIEGTRATSIAQSSRIQNIEPIKEHLSYGSLPAREKKQKIRNQLTQYNTSRFFNKPRTMKSRRRKSKHDTTGKCPIINSSQNSIEEEEIAQHLVPKSQPNDQLPSVDNFNEQPESLETERQADLPRKQKSMLRT